MAAKAVNTYTYHLLDNPTNLTQIKSVSLGYGLGILL